MSNFALAIKVKIRAGRMRWAFAQRSGGKPPTEAIAHFLILVNNQNRREKTGVSTKLRQLFIFLTFAKAIKSPARLDESHLVGQFPEDRSDW